MSTGLKANADGSAAIQVGGSDAITITSGLNTTFAGTIAVTGSTTALYPLVSGTAVASTSGTSIDFTGIPSTAKRITVMFNGVSFNGTSNMLIQIGSGSIINAGYTSTSATVISGSASSGVTSTAGFIEATGAAANIISGHAVLINISSTLWVFSHSHGFLNAAAASCGGGTSPTLSGALDRIRITTTNGTDTFDAGTINIMWE